jgi:RNA recognition motif-containing protein
MMRDKDGKSKGCAFVRFAQRGGADAACATLNGTLSLPGAARPMVVKYANPSEPRGKSNPNYGYPQQAPLAPRPPAALDAPASPPLWPPFTPCTPASRASPSPPPCREG